MTKPDLETRLEEASRGLLYPSESDFPFTPLRLGAGEPEDLVRSMGLGPELRVETVGLREFFEPLFEVGEDASDEEKAEAARYRALSNLFEAELSDARVVRVGSVDIDIYVVGRDQEGNWIGLKTRAVET